MMSKVSNDCTENPFPDRLKLALRFDPIALQSEINKLSTHFPQPTYFFYNVVPLRGAVGPAKSNGKILDYSDPTIYDWQDTNLMEHCPYIKQVLSSYKTQITNVRLLRLDAGAEVSEHKDPTLDAKFKSVVRLTIPIISDPSVTFLLNEEPVPMQEGDVWYLRLSDTHAVYNHSDKERINLSVDLVYNDWLAQQLMNACSID